MLDRTLAQLRTGTGDVVLPGMPAMQLAQQYLQGEGSLRTLGFAAVNAITRHVFDQRRLRAATGQPARWATWTCSLGTTWA